MAKARSIWGRFPARDAAQQELAGILQLEAERIEVVCDIYLRLVRLLQTYRRRQARTPLDAQAAQQELRNGLGEIAGVLQALDGLMARTEKQPDHYLAPQSLRELSPFRRFLTALAEDLEEVSRELEAGKLQALPDLRSMACTPVDWPD